MRPKRPDRPKRKARQTWKTGRASVKKDATSLSRTARESIAVLAVVAACYAVLVAAAALLKGGII